MESMHRWTPRLSSVVAGHRVRRLTFAEAVRDGSHAAFAYLTALPNRHDDDRTRG